MDTDAPDTTTSSPDCAITQSETIQHALMPTFVGYARLERWIETRNTTHPVYLLPLVEHGTDSGALRIDALLVVCQQQDEGGRIHYCRMRALDLTSCYGEPFDRDWRQREAAWHSLAAAVEEELRSRGFAIVPATIAAPRDLRLLQGRSDTIRFDPETKRYGKATS